MSIISKRGLVVEMFIVNCKAGVLTDLNVCMYVHAFYNSYIIFANNPFIWN